MNYSNKIITWGLCLFVFLLPWQARWIYGESLINGGVFEYGRLSLYGTEILLLALLILGIIAKRKAQSAKLKANIWIFLLLIWAGLSILWSADKMLAWYGWLRLMEGVGLAWLLAQNSKLKAQNCIILSLIASGVIQSLIAVWQWVVQYSFASKWLGMAFFNPAVAGVSVIDNGAGRFLRAYGSLPHPNILAGFLVICLLAAVILIINNHASPKLIKWLWAGVAILTMGLFLTFSRAGWLALLLSLILILLVHLRVGLKDLMTKRFLAITGLVVLIFGVLTSFYPDLVKTRLAGQARLEVQSNQQRLDLYNQAWPIIKSHWLLGIGLGQYPLKLYQDNPTLESWAYQPVHDTGVLTLAELGIVGLFLFIIIVIFAWRAKSPYWPLLLAILVLGLFDHYFRSFYFGIILWWLVIGLNLKLEIED